MHICPLSSLGSLTDDLCLFVFGVHMPSLYVTGVYSGAECVSVKGTGSTGRFTAVPALP